MLIFGDYTIQLQRINPSNVDLFRILFEDFITRQLGLQNICNLNVFLVKLKMLAFLFVHEQLSDRRNR
jgi:hypothetical protein